MMGGRGRILLVLPDKRGIQHVMVFAAAVVIAKG
jgi:hypothetical protein